MKKSFFYFAFTCLGVVFFATNLIAFPTMYFSLYNSEGMYDENGALLQENARVEVIWAGADGLIDPVNYDVTSSDFLRPSGDDQIVVNTLGNEMVYGIGYALEKAYTPEDQYYGHVDIPVQGLQADMYTAGGTDPNTPWDDKFYIRFFTSIDPQQSFHEEGYAQWGESLLLELPDHDPFDFTGSIYEDLDFYTPGSPLVANQIVPEPMSLTLGIVSLLLLKRRKRI